MALYIRFMASLAFGLVGLGLVLKVLLDQLFNDWDAAAAAKKFFRGVFSGEHPIVRARAEDVLMEAENERPRELSTRHIEKRREEIQQLNDVEQRLSIPLSFAAEEEVLPVPAMAAPPAASSKYAEDWGPN